MGTLEKPGSVSAAWLERTADTSWMSVIDVVMGGQHEFGAEFFEPLATMKDMHGHADGWIDVSSDEMCYSVMSPNGNVYDFRFVFRSL